MKHFENSCNMPLKDLQYMQHLDLFLQHSYETLTTYLRNIQNTLNICLEHVFLAHHISCLLGRMEARWRVKIARGSGLATLVGGGPAATVA
jgi:hypothetical protein